MGEKMDDKRIDRVLTYTVFHIGLYVSLIAALIASGNSLNWFWARFAIGFLVLAGFCGGVIAGNLSHYNGTFDDFEKSWMGVMWFRIMTYRWWAFTEHLAFWVGVLPITICYLIHGPAISSSKPSG